MKLRLPIFVALKILALFLLPSVAYAQNVTFPIDFFVENISEKSCSRFSSPASFRQQLKNVGTLVGNHDELFSSGSVSILHTKVSNAWLDLLEATYFVAARHDQAKAKEIVKVLVDLANSDALLTGPTPKQGRSGGCWTGGKGKALCTFGAVFHIVHAQTAIMLSAIVLEEFIDPSQKQILNKYFAKMYSKFLKPMRAYMLKDKGLYEFADSGIGVLAYARWTRDVKLAKAELKSRKGAFLRKIEKTGLINNNSYRGTRGYWYHTLGAEAAFGYALVARSFGYDFFKDKKLGPRFLALAKKTAWGNSNIHEFDSLPDRGKNSNYKKGQARLYMHPVAVNLPNILEKEFGIKILLSETYRRKSSWETVSRIIGFNTDCYYGSQ